jgi:hypothetical protein
VHSSVSECVIEIKVEELEDKQSERNDTDKENAMTESSTASLSEDEPEGSLCERTQGTTFSCLEFPWQIRIYKSPKTGKLVGYYKKEPVLHQVTRVYYPYYSYIVYQMVRYERVVITKHPDMFIHPPCETEIKTPPKKRVRKESNRKISNPRQKEGRNRLVISNFEPDPHDVMAYDVIVCATPQPEEEDTYSLDVNISSKNLTEKINKHIDKISQVKFGLDREFLKEFTEHNVDSKTKWSAFTISLESEMKKLYDLGKYFICHHKASQCDFKCAMNKIEQSTTLHTCTKEQNTLLRTFVEYSLNPIGQNLNAKFCHSYLAPKIKEYFQEHLIKLKQRMDQNFTLRFKKSIMAKSQWAVCLSVSLTIVFVLKIMEIFLTVFHN